MLRLPFLGLFSAERCGPCAVPRRHLEDLDGRDAIDFLQKEADVLVRRGRDILADKIGADGKLAVPSKRMSVEWTSGERCVAKSSR